jgi:hypothetical protein
MRLAAPDETEIAQALRSAAQSADISFDVVDPRGLTAFDVPQVSGYANSAGAVRKPRQHDHTSQREEQDDQRHLLQQTHTHSGSRMESGPLA